MTQLDPHDLRRAFGSFMSGVTVVTAQNTLGQPVGFTANSFTSVSLEPPLLLVCPGRFMSSYEVFAGCSHFAVNILTEGQQDVSNIFASFKGDRFAEVPHQRDARGNPLIEGAVAQFSCATHSVVEAGDHCVLIGQVEAYSHREAPGLGYAGGKYFGLGLERDALEPTDRQVICGAIIEMQGSVLLEKTEAGFRPPQIARKGRAHLRHDLTLHLRKRGVVAKLGAAYSVFDDPQTHSAYILATAGHLSSHSDVVVVPIEDLPDLEFTTDPVAEMMRRYALEAQGRNFSLYLGDTYSGETHSLLERS
ncbi:MAG: flavin reductase family protein [Pseudomonadota bacterium]